MEYTVTVKLTVTAETVKQVEQRIGLLKMQAKHVDKNCLITIATKN